MRAPTFAAYAPLLAFGARGEYQLKSRNGKKELKSARYETEKDSEVAYSAPYLRGHSKRGEWEELSVHVDIADEEFAMLEQGKKIQLASGHIGGTPIEITIQRLKPKKGKKDRSTR